jgi:Phage P2 GpU
MAILGAYGQLIFECSRRRVLTFDELSVTDSARYAQHDVHLQAPILEFCGPGLTEVSFTMNFNQMWNSDPHISLVVLRRYSKLGIVAPLLVGGKPIVLYSPNLWVLTSLGETHKWFTREGDLSGASVNVSLKEYRLLI